MRFQPALLLGLGLMFSLATTTVRAEGNAALGAKLAYTCHGCHGIPNYKNAAPVYSVPKLGGQHAKYIEASLKEYSDGNRSHPTMYAQASSMSDQDRADIAAYLAGQSDTNTDVVGTPPASAQTCVACHGTNGNGPLTDNPKLAGQQRDYLEKALRDYKSGVRKNPVMAGIITAVKEEDIPVLAAFYAKQKALCSTDQISDNGGKCK